MRAKLIWGMLMALVITSCTQDDKQIAEYGIKSLHANVDDNESFSRVGFTDGAAVFFWTKGDKIGVTTDQSSTHFMSMSYKGNGGESSGNFEGNMSGNPFGYAIYPDNDNHSMTGNTLTYYFPASYDYANLDDSYASKVGNGHNAPMWGSILNGSVSFKHLGGVAAIEVNGLPENTTDMKFEFKADSKINGYFSTDLQNPGPQLVTTAESISDVDKTVTITFKTAAGQTKGYFYVPLPVCPSGDTYNFTAKITDSEGNEIGEGAWDNINVQRTNIFRRVITASSISGGVGETKTVDNVSDINDQTFETNEDDLTVKISEVAGENSIKIPNSLVTNTTTFSFDEITDGAKITIENAVGGDYTGQIIIEIPEDATLPNVEASIPNGEVYIKQGNVTTLVVSSADNTTIIGAGATIGTLTVVKGNVHIEDGGSVGVINRSTDNNTTVYVVYDSANAPSITMGEGVVLMSAAEWKLRKEIENNGNVTLKSNITLTDAITINKAVTIDLNGYTIENKSAANTTKLGNAADECIVFYVDGSEANLTLNATNGGKVIATGDGSTSYYNTAVWVTNGATATINGGEYSNTADPDDDGCDLIYGRDGGKIYVKGGTFKAGAIRSNLGGGIYGVLNCKDSKGSQIIVSGGKFYEYGAAEAAKVGNGEVILLEGGYYWSAKDAEGYYTVTDKIETEEALRSAIANTDNVKLGSNITLTDAITINKAVTIDLNGYTIENKSANNTTQLGSVADECIVFYVDGTNANLTLNATNGGKVIATGDGSTSYYNTAVWVTNGATATINGGEYSNTADPDDDGCDLIYGRDGGKIYVKGGTFKAGAIRSNLGGGIYGVLNCKDSKGSQIIVSGGKFYEYGAAEAAKVGNGEVILLGEGYKWSEKGNDNYYSVVSAND